MLALALAAAASCGPAHAPTLARDAQARVYSRGGAVFACEGRTTIALGPRHAVRAVKLADGYAAVRREVGRRGERLATYRLRRGARVAATGGRFNAFTIARTGLTAYIATSAGGRRRVGVLGGYSVDPGASADPRFLAVAGGIVAYRDASGVHVFDSHRSSPRGTLVDDHGIRLIGARTLFLRAGRSAPVPIGSAAPAACGSHGCRGVDLVQIAGTFAGVRFLDQDAGYDATSLTVHDTASRRASQPCRPPDPGRDYYDRVVAFVLVATGAVACARVVAGTPQILSGGVVADSGAGIDLWSLARRGNQIVWRHDGQERSAPLPTASG
jgi:hypothetical protein